MDKADILKRINELLALPPTENIVELVNGCVSMLVLVYGGKSPQLAHFKTSIAQITVGGATGVWEDQEKTLVAQGTLINLKREIEGGLTGNLKQQITGEVLIDFIQLARSILDEKGDGAKNVAAILAAAAFEDTIRRMGENLAGVIGQDDLSDVLKKLKDAGAIQSPQVGIAQSYLSFRNHALHANWDKIQRESIHSVLGFVEQLLIKHFA
jgi:hypothetical protein